MVFGGPGSGRISIPVHLVPDKLPVTGGLERICARKEPLPIVSDDEALRVTDNSVFVSDLIQEASPKHMRATQLRRGEQRDQCATLEELEACVNGEALVAGAV